MINLFHSSLKVAALYIMYHRETLSVGSIGFLLMVFGAFELVSLLIYCYFSKGLNLPYSFKFSAYRKLIKESLPQFLSAIFDSSLSRVDWILLGIISTAANIADYSFAYRAYEVAKLPLVVLSPIILVRYSKILSNNELSDENKKGTVRLLYITVFVAVIVILVANLLWRPVIGTLTHGKYGASNATIFMILSLCLPLHFIINILWSISFAGRKYRHITKVTIMIAVVNLLLNLLLIPFIGGIGAAIAYVSATLVQVLAYHRLVDRNFLKFSILQVLLMPVFGVAAFAVSFIVFHNIWLQLIIAVGMYSTLCILFKMVRLNDVAILKTYLKR